ncbi:hypothetical protein F5J12DRAFT_897824 [Pisolithus orientalis]|uniref:uncharacterized protein n=1 Tax=Pisolithus orientalis TaxID=936130 RepID=UPI00222420FC|nr:uncharacterized protein F5J12DRAFT_897824 [Pisolithus orientalis]KAI5989780.1 hypothetical protein F5J12DRAFT_897824 [Pisolithus orientalis]
MSDYYWQQSLPTITQMKYILQIYYRSEELADGTIRITCTNLNDEITEHRTFIPTCYHKALTHTLWRYYLLIDLHVHFKKNPHKKYTEFRPHLLRNIVLLDNISKVSDLPISKNTFALEYLVGRHDPNSVNYFRAHCPINIERIMYEFEWSWDAYKERVPTRLYGERYDWDVENIPDADFTILWDEAVEWYSRQPDPAWISKWVPWVEIDGVVASMQSTGDADEGNVGTGAGDDEAGGPGAGSQGGNVPMGGMENSDPPPSNQASSMMSGEVSVAYLYIDVTAEADRKQWRIRRPHCLEFCNSCRESSGVPSQPGKSLLPQ